MNRTAGLLAVRLDSFSEGLNSPDPFYFGEILDLQVYLVNENIRA
jgi:hypothetical protein